MKDIDEEPLLTWALSNNNVPIKFNGPAYEEEHDKIRLTGQISRIYNLMRDKKWRTLGEVAQATGDPEASISAQLRHLRKERFGGHTVERQRRGEPSNGLWEYCLIIKPKDKS